MAYQHQPSSRDAGLARVAAVTIALSVLGVGTTAGISAAIAATTPAPSAKKAGTDYTKPKAGKPGNPGGTGTKGKTPTQQPSQPGGGTVAPPADRPESSSGDEDTSSGGS